MPEPEGDGEENADDDREELGGVDRALAELAVGADESPIEIIKIRIFVSPRITILRLRTHQTADAVKNTWLCGHVRLLFCVGKQMSTTFENIHSFMPTCTNPARIVEINCAINVTNRR